MDSCPLTSDVAKNQISDEVSVIPDTVKNGKACCVINGKSGTTINGKIKKYGREASVFLNHFRGMKKDEIQKHTNITLASMTVRLFVLLLFNFAVKASHLNIVIK